MKSVTQTPPGRRKFTVLLALFGAVFLIPASSLAAVKVFGPMTATPASTNITPGVATNLITTINLSGNGSGSTGYKGPATFTLSVLPAEPTIMLSISNNPVVLATASSVT